MLLKIQPIKTLSLHTKSHAQVWKIDIQSWNFITDNLPLPLHSILLTRKSSKWEIWLVNLGLVNKKKMATPFQRTFYHHILSVLAKEFLPCYFFAGTITARHHSDRGNHYSIQITVEASHINWSYLSVLYLLEISMNYVKQMSCSPYKKQCLIARAA